jgi:hypothetical protein
MRLTFGSSFLFGSVFNVISAAITAGTGAGAGIVFFAGAEHPCNKSEKQNFFHVGLFSRLNVVNFR